MKRRRRSCLITVCVLPKEPEALKVPQTGDGLSGGGFPFAFVAAYFWGIDTSSSSSDRHTGN